MHKLFANLKGFYFCYFDTYGGGTLLDLSSYLEGDNKSFIFDCGAGDNFSYNVNCGYGHGNNMGSTFGNGYGDGYDCGNCEGKGSSRYNHICLCEIDA
jgi:hypothetical protein